ENVGHLPPDACAREVPAEDHGEKCDDGTDAGSAKSAAQIETPRDRVANREADRRDEYSNEDRVEDDAADSRNVRRRQWNARRIDGEPDDRAGERCRFDVRRSVPRYSLIASDRPKLTPRHFAKQRAIES